MSSPAYQRHLASARILMSRCVSDACDNLAAELLRANTASRSLRQVRLEAAAVMERHRAVFLAGFDAAFEAGLREAAEASPLATTKPLDLDDLQIMDDTRVQEEIEVAHAAQVLGEEASFELHRVVRFESALRQGEGWRASVAKSPVGPPALARALWSGSERLNLDVAGRGQVVRAAAEWMAPRLRAVYKDLLVAGDEREVIAMTRRNGVDVDITRATDDAPSTGFDVTRPGALFELIDLNGSARPAPVADTMPMPMDGDGLRIPGLIHRHREELAALEANSRPDQVIGLIARIFDQVLADTNLPADARLWIGRLRPGVIRVASDDASLLGSHRHPVWRLINGLATEMVAGGLPPDFERWVANCVEKIGQAPSTRAFEAAGNALVRKRRSLAQRRLTDVDPALALLRRTAAMEDQVGRARDGLQRRLDASRVPSVVQRFLLTVWVLVCAQEADGAASPTAARVADDLLWSTDIERSRADGPRVMAMMTGLVEALERGMKSVGVTDDHRIAWLDQLAEVHLDALKRATGAAPRAVPEPAEPAAPDEPRAVAAARPADAQVPGPEFIAELEVGDRLRLQMLGDWVEVQLLWMSENRHFLLFASAQGGRSHSLTSRSLEALRANGLLRVIEERNALERAADGLLRGGAPAA